MPNCFGVLPLHSSGEGWMFMKRRSFISMLGFGVTALAGCAPHVPKFIGIDLAGAPYGGNFHLNGSDGHPHAMTDFKGKYVMLFFGFTQCPDVCPTTLARAVEIQKKLGPDGGKVQVIFITIDPERDTPDLLGWYMRAFDPGFLGLTGDAAQIAQAARDFKVFYKKVPSGNSYTMDHTAITYILDTKGHIRLAFRHEQSADECALDLRTLMESDSRFF
jgi:protein SCO1/2